MTASSGNLPGPDATVLPFGEIDPLKFEEFCTAFLNSGPVFRINRNGRLLQRTVANAHRVSLPGAPDGGVDLSADMQAGEVWLFQCKRVKRLKPSEVKTLIARAESGSPHADQYVLVTAGKLSAEAQSLVRTRPKWLLWDAERLTTAVATLKPPDDAMKLVQRFFDAGWMRRLFPWQSSPLLRWQDFFARDLESEDRHFHYGGKFVDRGGTLDALLEFAGGEGKAACILASAGGTGKSRLLLELARKLENLPSGREVRFLNQAYGSHAAEAADFIHHRQNLFLVTDDAHRQGNELGVVAGSLAGTKKGRLLLVTRPQAVGALRDLLYRHGFAGKVDSVIEVPKWSSKDLHVLARSVLGSRLSTHAPAIAELSDGCPLLVVLAGSLLKKNEALANLLKTEDFRHRVFLSFQNDFLDRFAEPRRSNLKRLLQVLAMIGPALRDEKLINFCAAASGDDVMSVAENLDLMNAARLLTESREGARIVPDLFNDALVQQTCFDSRGRVPALTCRVCELAAVPDFPNLKYPDVLPSLLRNLAEAEWCHRASGFDQSPLEPVWQEFRRRLAAATHWERAQLLGQWAKIAIFQPERTIELVEWAREAQRAPKPRGLLRASLKGSRLNTHQEVLSRLAPLLKPVAIWHEAQRSRALDLLWQLGRSPANPHPHNRVDPVETIAQVAGAALHHPQESRLAVLSWFEAKLKDRRELNRLRKQSWIISAVLKAFLQRGIENNWQEGRTVHFQQIPIHLLRPDPRPLMHRALAVTREVLLRGDPILALGALPVLETAIERLTFLFGYDFSDSDHEWWRPERKTALGVLKEAIGRYKDEPGVLQRMRKILQNHVRYEEDPEFREACQSLYNSIPDTFEMRIVRILTGYEHDEFDGRQTDDNFKEWLNDARTWWANFTSGVAREFVERHPTAAIAHRFLLTKHCELETLGFTPATGALLAGATQAAPSIALPLLKEIEKSPPGELEGFVHTILPAVAKTSPDYYKAFLDSLSHETRPGLVISAISFLEWERAEAGLTEQERFVLLNLADRKEPEIASAIARAAHSHFLHDPTLKGQLLERLQPATVTAQTLLLEALARLAEEHPDSLSDEEVERILFKASDLTWDSHGSSRQRLQKLATSFPKGVYLFLRRLVRKRGKKYQGGLGTLVFERFPLGRITDAGFLDAEINAQWQHALSHENERVWTLSLLRMLLWSEPKQTEHRLLRLVDECSIPEALQTAAKILAFDHSSAIWDWPGMTAAFLRQARLIGCEEPVRRTLQQGAGPKGRGFTNGELDPQYRYVLESSQDAATRFAHDPLLAEFYRGIADDESRNIEMHRKWFGADSDET